MRHVDVAIVGGGITGLAAAHRLGELGARFMLFEQSARLGGHVRTERRGELLLEAGPDQFVRHKEACLALCGRLGLEDELVEVDPARATPHVVLRGRPVPLPEGFTLAGPTRLLPLLRSPLLSMRGLMHLALSSRHAAREADESLESHVTRRFGREAYERIFEPIVAGIFTADGARLSVAALAPQPAPSRPARGGCISLKPGMGGLVDRLAARLAPESVRRRAVVEHCERAADGASFRLTVRGDEPVAARAVVLACPAYASARLLESEPELSLALAEIPYASCATVNLVYAAGAVRRPFDHAGFFVGRAEGLPILACSQVGVKFPERVPSGRIVLRAFLGGARDPGVLDEDDAGLVGLAHGALARLLAIAADPLEAHVFRFPRSMPQLEVGFRARIAALVEHERQRPGLFLAGGAKGALGLPDCIASGEQAAAAAAAHVSSIVRAAAPHLALGHR